MFLHLDMEPKIIDRMTGCLPLHSLVYCSIIAVEKFSADIVIFMEDIFTFKSSLELFLCTSMDVQSLLAFLAVEEKKYPEP